MKNFRFLLLTFAVLAAVSFLGVRALDRIDDKDSETEPTVTVVASFYPIYVACENLLAGIDNVTLYSLSEPQTGCLHDYTLTPEDMKLLSDADVFVINGGGAEAFLTDVADAYPSLVTVDASANLGTLTIDGEVNSHCWMSVPTYARQIEAIRDGLIASIGEDDSTDGIAGDQADSTTDNPDGLVARIAANATAYLAALDKLDEQQDSLRDALFDTGVILFHEAYGYVASDYAMNVRYLLDLDEEREVSAGEVADVLTAIHVFDVPLVLAEAEYGAEMGALVEDETDASVLYLDTIVRGTADDTPDAYLTRMQANIDLLRAYADTLSAAE